MALNKTHKSLDEIKYCLYEVTPNQERFNVHMYCIDFY